MKKIMTITLIALALSATLMPMFIFLKRISFFQQVHVANTTVSNIDLLVRDVPLHARYNEQTYYCMLDTTNLQEKLSIDFESSKQKYAEMTKYLNNSASTIQSYAQFAPHNCEATDTVAIIIPIRNRDEHLHILLGHLHPILQKQLLRYSFCLFYLTTNDLQLHQTSIIF